MSVAVRIVALYAGIAGLSSLIAVAHVGAGIGVGILLSLLLSVLLLSTWANHR